MDNSNDFDNKQAGDCTREEMNNHDPKMDKGASLGNARVHNKDFKADMLKRVAEHMDVEWDPIRGRNALKVNGVACDSRNEALTMAVQVSCLERSRLI